MCTVSDLEEADDGAQDDLLQPGEEDDDVLGDSLHDEPSNDEDVTSIVVSDILQEDKEDNDDTSNIEYSADAMTMTWEPPVSALSSKSCCDAV